ncbi:virulence-associated E family protein [Clostridium sartagoforme]|uniref:virulence-associated E family protein n=1 Tax=Clostridium sartagoforme TaxID=84031 RepID=UPI0031DAE426
MKLFVSIGNSRMEKKWNGQEMELEAFIERISHTHRTAETIEQYKKMPKGKQDDIKDVGGFVLGKLKGGRRKKDSVISRSAITLDMDYGTEDIIDQLELFHDMKCVLYSTHKHTPENPRLRLIIFLTREVTPDEYGAISRMIASDIGIELFDDSTYEPSRLMYWPSTSSDGEFIYKEIDGKLVNPDEVLARYQNWKDLSLWPVSKRQHIVVQRDIKKQADPLAKDGIIGAFNRTYTITQAMDTFISDVYKPSAMIGRYDYVPADSASGVVVYEDKFVFSHHATDPACNRLMNAFDVVRIHKFGHLDTKADEDTESTKLPSFKAMQEFASQNEVVKLTLGKEREEAAKMEFENEEEWRSGLEYSRQGVIVNNLKNLLLILNHDENLKSIVFNQLSDGMEIKGEVPWQHPSKFWRDADDAQLISYVDLTYGNFSARNYDIAVSKVSDDRSYHPIKEFLASLPEWDKVPRVDTLLIDFLGATDNLYVRAVTRKTLCAAIARVMKPGCKFDTMLVLSGPQGKGKSTLIAKLCGEWFNDSLLLSDTKDKTAAEKLQGFWILEIGELAGLKKTDIETLRGFLSRQNDIYRAAFGRRATPHPRQCVFIGTTNADTYLRDITGNRRFWPVKVPGGTGRGSWELADEEVAQIWAETLYYYNDGEQIHLPKELEEMAVHEQREAMEQDEREGTIRDYLDMLLPVNWDSMSLYERRNFINGSEFDGGNHVGVNKRKRVCNMEIWCECFGKERGNLKRQDANEIAAIMSNIEGWKHPEGKMRFSIYGVVKGYVREEN